MQIPSSIKYLFSRDRKFYYALRNVLGFFPKNLSLYRLAFMHRSYSEEHPSGMRLSNERLEYLGDAVLGAVVAEMLFKKFPYREEGFLTEMRAKIVNREHLNKLALKLGLDHFMGDLVESAKNRSVYGDAFEALIGAVYMDKGYGHARKLIMNRFMKHHVDIEELEETEVNFKSKLINWAQRERKKVVFELLEEIVGKHNKRILRVRVLVDGDELAQGEDYSKKRAEQIAARKACEALNLASQ